MGLGQHPNAEEERACSMGGGLRLRSHGQTGSEPFAFAEGALGLHLNRVQLVMEGAKATACR